jgi:hypothetical protein
MDAMHGSIEQVETSTSQSPLSRCSAAGCPCRDVRIVLRRKAAFFADLAARRGETADRIVLPEAGWSLPSAPAA